MKCYVLLLFCVTSDVDCAISSPDASPSKCLPNFISLQQISEQEDLLFSSYLAHNCSQKDVYWYNSTDLVPFWHSLLLVHVFYPDEYEFCMHLMIISIKATCRDQSCLTCPITYLSVTCLCIYIFILYILKTLSFHCFIFSKFVICKIHVLNIFKILFFLI